MEKSTIIPAKEAWKTPLIDFHSHILPDMDDGSSSVAESHGMWGLCMQQGVDIIAATPHFYAERETPDRFLRRRERARALMDGLKKEDPLSPRLILGAEVLYFDGMSHSRDLKSLCIEGTDVVLIELPQKKWTDRMLEDICNIPRHGLIPLIAHIERYLLPLSANLGLVRLLRAGVLTQANAAFFLNTWTYKTAIQMLQEGSISLLGSDCHHMNKRRPNMGPAAKNIEKCIGKAALERMYLLGRSLLHTPA